MLSDENAKLADWRAVIVEDLTSCNEELCAIRAQMTISHTQTLGAALLIVAALVYVVFDGPLAVALMLEVVGAALGFRALVFMDRLVADARATAERLDNLRTLLGEVETQMLANGHTFAAGG